MDHAKQVTPADVTSAALDKSDPVAGGALTAAWLPSAASCCGCPAPLLEPSHAFSAAPHPPHPQPAVEALDMFLAIVGAEAGHMALRSLASGGVYICGGIFPKVSRLPGTAWQRPGCACALQRACASGPMPARRRWRRRWGGQPSLSTSHLLLLRVLTGDGASDGGAGAGGLPLARLALPR